MNAFTNGFAAGHPYSRDACIVVGWFDSDVTSATKDPAFA